MQKHELIYYAKVAGWTVAALYIYSYIWKKSRITATVLLALVLLMCIREIVSWEKIKEYTIVNSGNYDYDYSADE